jgi:hypothetical protein
MTETEEQQVRELADDLANATQGAGEPRCIVAAFATMPENRVVLTMQNWIDLEAIRSPLLQLRLPEHLEELEMAANVFRMTVRNLSADNAIRVACVIRQAADEAFSLAMPMRPSSSHIDNGSDTSDGFGTWLPLFAFLVAECGLTPAAAGALPVSHAFALLAAHRRNQGWECAGASYAQRDFVSAEEAA